MFSQGNRGLLRLRDLPRAPSRRWWQSQNMNPGPGFACPEMWPEPDQATFLDSSGLTYGRHLQGQRPGRVLETTEEPSLHLGFCECGYEVVCLGWEKKKKKTLSQQSGPSTWDLRGIMAPSLGLRGPRQQCAHFALSVLSHAGTAAPSACWEGP